MTSSGNNAVVRSSIEAGIQEREDNFLLTMKPFDFTIVDDDDELDLPSQATNPPNIIPASSSVLPSVLRPAASQQPTVEMLQSLGILVRDFAYESTLPPIAPVPRVPRQIQPSARPLKRAGGEATSSHPPFSREATNACTETNRKPNSLVRKPTEPLEEFELPVPKRMRCADLSRPFLLGSQLPFRTFRRTPPKTPIASPPTSPLFGSPSQESSQEASQASQLVKTPTGAESWHIEDTSSISASQLDTDSSAFVPEEIFYSQVGLSPQPSQPATSFLTPMRSPVSSLCVSPPSQADDTLDSSHLIPQIPNSPREHHRGIKNPTVKASTERSSRYFLRRRSLLSVHAPTRSRYPHPLTPTKKGSPKASPLPPRRRLQKSALSR
ncbi:hypothetical protein K503DRAFT_765354 [Rhizopogon vinicolor AM-OR11-026]|uniref:Uncharacterized protein n=1 Tax=Rhizopogon vinicolor AM-OR11-026 TaxID=1314800 RepID=A0A1B7NGF4_9AGAM|nr:hypothetical protein K503DRAFT_765354 [Rhizopogon vinicolor AM-OR11-026]